MKLNRKSFLAACAVPAAFFLAPSAQAQADMYAGQIFLMASPYCPEDSMEANGATLAIQQYQLLYAVIGNKYGGSVGKMNFALPTLAAPLPDMRYCIVFRGMYPMRP